MQRVPPQHRIVNDRHVDNPYHGQHRARPIGPCRVVHPVLEEIDAERDDLKIVSINVDENQQTAAEYEVLSIPTMILFKDGQMAKKIVGAMPKRRLEAELEPALA